MQKLAEKMIEVMKSCRYVPKSGVNTFHKYRYTTFSDILEKVNTALTSQGIASLVIPEIISNEEVITSKGNKEHLVTVKVEVTLIDKDSGETAKFVGFGAGQDAGDKAILKAQTAGLKYAYLMTFSMATGEETENYSPPVTVQNRNQNQPVEYVCSNCGNKITEQMAKFSQNKYHSYLCIECQKKKNG